ncbi:MAG: PilZ domain-containing protein [Bryobacteraceae bacterium]|jgi:hypothetical protein
MMLQTLGNAAVLPMRGGRWNIEKDMFQAMGEETSALPGAGVQACRFDQRCAVRFPIEQDVRYKVFTRNTVEVGFGKTVNMSSNGVLFTTERPLALGARLEVALNWPALLDHKCALKVVTTGRVVRSESGLAAIAIERYEFRTQGIHSLV